MLKVEEKVTLIWQNIDPEKFDPYKNAKPILFRIGYCFWQRFLNLLPL